MTTFSVYDELADSLAIEVKREIAERYFTHRKVVEEEVEDYLDALKKFRKKEEEVTKELLRLVYLLEDEDLLKRFHELTGIPLEEFADEYLLEASHIRKRLFRGLKGRGLTSKGRFLHLFEDTYKRLFEKLNSYRKEFLKLKRQAELVNSDIEEFNRSYDLSSMLSFFNALSDSSPPIGAVENMEEVTKSLEGQLKFKKVPPPEEEFPELKVPPEWKKVHRELSKLAKEAYKRHPESAREILGVLSG